MRALRAAAWSAVGFVAVYLLFVRTGVGQRVDESAMIRLADVFGSPRWAELLLLSVSELTLLMATVALVASTAALRGRRAALYCTLTIGSVVVASQVLKPLLGRPPLMTEAIANSFPSGHVAAVAALGAALVVALAPRQRPLAVALLVPVIGLTGLATIVLEWHRPSDVMGSVLLAVAVGSFAAYLTDRYSSRDANPGDAPAAVTPSSRDRRLSVPSA